MIELRDICKSWDGGKTFAVKNVSLEVPTGKVLALLGGSGSGKSTTVKMINRLIEPTSGSILVGGEDITQQDPTLLRRRIGYVFQSIGLLPHMTVADNVTLLLKLQGVAADERNERANQLLDMVDLPSETFARRLPRELSGGQRQRVGFARALAAEPKVMLLDEPFGALDPVTRDTLQVEFQRIQRQLGLTAVIVTHDMAEALLLADVIAVMHMGEVLRIGTPRELLQDPGDDYVARLLETPRRHGQLVHELSS
ncbi:ATP-binding cassette domain-containing protein [Bremerella sp. JC817]|uniref:ATP-binding cassette domain-containing protein n=1 Tax=Bremerella sp. JC817 TaxID=3231756 RepID=UPI00345A853B